MKKGRWIRILVLATAVMWSACATEGGDETDVAGGFDGVEQGSEGGPCYGNGTCNEGLLCEQGVCLSCQGAVGCVCYTNQTCDEGFVCMAGFCFSDGETACEEDADCGQPGVTCVEGECQQDPDWTPGISEEYHNEFETLTCDADGCEPACNEEGCGSGGQVQSWGSVVGEFCGVQAYSNAKSSITGCDYANAKLNGINGGKFGYEYQCVELTFRFLCTVYNDQLGCLDSGKAGKPYGNAWQWFENTSHPALSHEKVERLKSGETTQPPRRGDIVVFGKSSDYGGYGHVVVARDVNLELGYVQVMEQNYSCSEQDGSRNIALHNEGGKYWIKSALGWLRVKNAGEACAAPPAKLVTPEQDEVFSEGDDVHFSWVLGTPGLDHYLRVRNTDTDILVLEDVNVGTNTSFDWKSAPVGNYRWVVNYDSVDCSNGTCVSEQRLFTVNSSGVCEPDHHKKKCYNGDVYWFNGCDIMNDLADDCASGEQCADGKCQEPICSSTCDGCCVGNDCKPGTADSACGKNGAQCANCSGGDVCSNGFCTADCGDGQCNGKDTKCNCPQDCGACSGCCSGATCETGDSNSACGEYAEACMNCSANAEVCDGQQCVAEPPKCGDGDCNGSETKCSCPGDCGACSGCCSGSACNLGTSDSSCGKSGGSCTNCSNSSKICQSQQCVAPPVTCGDNDCNGSETKCSCPGDCGACSGCCSGSACNSGTSDSSCGKSGSNCQSCSGVEECENGNCVDKTTTVSSVSPLSAAYGISTTFTVSGKNLPSTIIGWIGDCDDLTTVSKTSSTYKFKCTPKWHGAGVKDGVIKAKTGGAVLKEFTVNVTCSSPKIVDVEPLTAYLNQTTTFTAAGACLPSTIVAWIGNCENLTYVHKMTHELKFKCKPTGTKGNKEGLIKTKSGGSTIKSFTLNVK